MNNALNTLQSGQQTAFGTANATATAKLQTVTSFKPSAELEARIVDQTYSSLAPGYNTVLDGHSASAAFETEAASYEDINYWLGAMFSFATPTGVGPYVRAYAAPLTAMATPKFLTLQYGQTGHVIQLNDCSVSTLTLSGASNGTLQCGGAILASKAVVGALQALSDRTGQTVAMGNHASVYIDAWDGTIGTTEIASAAFAWEMTVNANREYRGYLGDIAPTAWQDNPWTGQLKLSMEVDTTTAALVAAILADPNTILQKQIQIKYTTGTGATERTLTIGFAGQALEAPELFTDRNGVTAFDLTMTGVYNSTMANWLKVDSTSNTAVMI